MAGSSRTLNATVGTLTASILLSYVPLFEGTILRGYRDPIGIVTACTGHTKTAILGRPYTADECRQLLDQDLIEHAVPVLTCVPELAGHPYQLASAISFAFNVGVSKFCNSTTARRFKSGNWISACRALNEKDNGRPQWVFADGVILPGLVTRRAIERELCETELPEAY
jgi:lysozyme